MRPMRLVVLLSALLLAFAELASADCGQTVMNGDGSYEWAIAWSDEAQQAPDYGAFAECFHGESEVCAAVFDFTAVVPIVNGMDVYLWEDSGGAPGDIAYLLPNVGTGGIAFWPSVSRHVIELEEPQCMSGTWWIGFWGDWAGSAAGWFVAQDKDGPSGCPMTKIAPGLGYPSGWQSVEVAFGQTSALGIGVQLRDCPHPVPAQRRSWGRIKRLYN